MTTVVKQMDGIQTPDLSPLESRPVVDDITVVIPTLGRPILEESLHWIALGTRWPARIIVVDQSSSPVIAGWLARLRSFGLKAEHVPSSQRGRAAAVNRGIERVRTRFVAVTDDDCFVEPDWLENLAAGLCENPEAIITGRVEAAGDERVPVVVTSRTARIQRRPGLKYDSMCGGNMGVAITVIQRVGLFDEDPCVSAGEDCEYSYRALRSGVPIIYAPEVGVRHFGWRDASQQESRYRDYARSLGGFYGKYLRRGDWFIALRIVITLLRALRRRLRGLIIGSHERVNMTELLSGVLAGWRSGRSS
jgi:GT2 family glycosyltransferase